MRVVLDTNILARANPYAAGAARALLDLIRHSDDVVLIVSPFLLAELERVLNYPRLRALWPLAQSDIAHFVDALQQFAEVVSPGQAEAVIAEDPDDDPVLATAVAGRADVVCSLDRHFASPAVAEYARRHQFEVVSDVELLQRLRRAT